jgi:subtilisin family serine protease
VQQSSVPSKKIPIDYIVKVTLEVVSRSMRKLSGVFTQSINIKISIMLHRPGTEIYSTCTVPPNIVAYAIMSGTSQAAPHVAGVKAW